MTLYTLYLFGVSIAILSSACILASFFLRTLSSIRDRDLPSDTGMDITVISMKDGKPDMDTDPRPVSKCQKAANILLMPAIFLCGVSLVAMFTYCRYNSMALRHGAFDDFARTSTLSVIKDRCGHMFEDQSKDLPEDLSGTILIFFKYTCDDCYDTHDQIMAVLERENVQNVYFVSSRSDAAVALIETYGVDGVPWGVYVETDGTPSVTDILYDEFETVSSEKFREENLMKIIDAQKGASQ